MHVNSRKSERDGSKFIIYDQHQELLLPKRVQDFVPKDHVASAVSEVVDHVEIGCITETYDHLGAPAYHPRMLVKVIIYAQIQGVRSSRKIETLLKDSLAFMYLSGGQTPDFRTLCRFRRKHSEKIGESSMRWWRSVQG